MKSTLLSLLWKEWREQRWKLVLMIAGCLVISLGWVIVSREWSAALAGPIIMLMFGVPVIAMFVGADIAAGERARGTVDFLRAMPFPMKKAALAKLLVASATVAAPALLAAVVSTMAVLFCWARSEFWAADPCFEQFKNDVLPTGLATFVIAAGTVSVLIWTAAPGVNHVDELRAGAIGLLTMALVWGAIIYTTYLVGQAYKPPVPTAIKHGVEVVVAGAPGGVFGGLERIGEAAWIADPWRKSWPFALSFLASHGVLAGWYVARLGRRAKPQAVGANPPAVRSGSGWLSPPRRSRATAIAWKQFRESAPLAALGGLAILVISAAVARATSTIARDDFVETWQMTTLGAWLMAGVFVSVVAGIGVFYDDLRPGLHTFWRSRRIDVDAWFWIKLLTGLAITVFVLAVGPLLTVGLLRFMAQPLLVPAQESALNQIAGAGLLLHAVTFVLAALAIALVRQPVLAAMLTIGTWVTGAVSIGTWFDDLPEPPLGPMVCLGLVSLAGLSVIAWQCVRRDWGWKS